MKTKKAYIINKFKTPNHVFELIETWLEPIQIADDGEQPYKIKEILLSDYKNISTDQIEKYKNLPSDNYICTERGGVWRVLEPVSVEVKEPIFLKQISGTSDEYEYVLLKEGDEIREGDEMLIIAVGMGFQPSWKNVDPNQIRVPKGLPFRRRVLKSELELKIGELIHDKIELKSDTKELIKILLKMTSTLQKGSTVICGTLHGIEGKSPKKPYQKSEAGNEEF